MTCYANMKFRGELCSVYLNEALIYFKIATDEGERKSMNSFAYSRSYLRRKSSKEI